MRLLLSATFALLLTGCAGYQLGGIKPLVMEGIETVSVQTFANETLTPRVEVLAANSLTKAIQEDGTYTIVSNTEADAVIYGKITEVRRSQARAVRGNVFETREFNLYVTLQIEVMNRVTGEILATRTAQGATSFFFSDDLLQEERQALPLAIEQAAQSLTSSIANGF